MTLALSIQGPSYTIVLADQRLTEAGIPVTEHSNKLLAVHTRDGRFGVAYAGLAYSQDRTFVTRDWILKSAVRAAAGDPTYLGIPSGLAREAATTFGSHPAIMPMSSRQQRLTILIAGVTNERPPISRLALISNFQDFETRIDSPEAWKEFRIMRWKVADPTSQTSICVQRIGAWQALRERRAIRIEAALKNQKPAKTVAEMAAGLLREASSEREGQTIGMQVSGIIIPHDETREIELWFNTSIPTDEAFVPDFINAAQPGRPVYGRFTKLAKVREKEAASPAWIPRVRRKERCPCGSGKRYGACHGQRGRK